MTKFTFRSFTRKYFFYIKAKLTVSKSLSNSWRYFFDSTHLKGCHFFSSIFQPKGKSQNLVEPCFPHTFYPSFMPPIRSGDYSSFNLSHFLAWCGEWWLMTQSLYINQDMLILYRGSLKSAAFAVTRNRALLEKLQQNQQSLWYF